MDNIMFKDQTELEILEGASLSGVTVGVDSFADLETVADALVLEGNLDTVIFKSNGQETGVYDHLALVDPLFHAVYRSAGKVFASFALREKTELERKIDSIEKSQEVQDGAIMELAEMLGVSKNGNLLCDEN